jgi:hypothetical protein
MQENSIFTVIAVTISHYTTTRDSKTFLFIYISLKMDTEVSSETPVNVCHTTGRHIVEDSNLYCDRQEESQKERDHWEDQDVGG